MARIQLVTDVSRWGLLRWPAKTRTRLVATTLVVTAVTLGFGLWSAHFVLETSASVILNLLLITANMMGVIVAAFLQAALVGDLFFAGPWRERVFLGVKTTGDEFEATTVEDRSAEFVIVLFLLVIANAFAINTASGGFFDQYHNEGFFQARMRAADADERLDALETLADPMNYTLWERPGIQDLVLARFDDADARVRAQAAWSAGKMHISTAREPLHRLLESDAQPAAVRAEAAVALGKRGEDTDARRALLELLVNAEHDDAERRELLLGALRGLGLMASRQASAALVPFTEIADDDELRAYAFWALARAGDERVREHLREINATDPEGTLRCQLFDAFKALGTPDDTMWARREFQRVEPEARCEALVWEERDGTRHQIVWGETVRVKLLKIVANTNPFDHRAWIQRLINDPDEDVRIREIANQVIKQMDRAESKRR